MRTRISNGKDTGRWQGCIAASFAVLSLCLISCGIGYLRAWSVQEEVQTRTIAFSLGDSEKYGRKVFYGARVFYEPSENPGEVDVKVEVEIGPGNGYFQSAVVIGHATTAEEARARWRKIEWTREAMLVGEGSDQYSLPMASLESGR